MKVPLLAAIFASVAVALPFFDQEQGQEAATQVYQDQGTGLYYEFDDETQQYFQVDPASLDFYPADEEAAANFQAAVEAEEGQDQEYFDDFEEYSRLSQYQAVHQAAGLASAAVAGARGYGLQMDEGSEPHAHEVRLAQAAAKGAEARAALTVKNAGQAAVEHVMEGHAFGVVDGLHAANHLRKGEYRDAALSASRVGTAAIGTAIDAVAPLAGTATKMALDHAVPMAADTAKDLHSHAKGYSKLNGRDPDDHGNGVWHDHGAPTPPPAHGAHHAAPAHGAHHAAPAHGAHGHDAHGSSSVAHASHPVQPVHPLHHGAPNIPKIAPPPAGKPRNRFQADEDEDLEQEFDFDNDDEFEFDDAEAADL